LVPLSSGANLRLAVACADTFLVRAVTLAQIFQVVGSIGDIEENIWPDVLGLDEAEPFSALK